MYQYTYVRKKCGTKSHCEGIRLILMSHKTESILEEVYIFLGSCYVVRQNTFVTSYWVSKGIVNKVDFSLSHESQANFLDEEFEIVTLD